MRGILSKKTLNFCCNAFDNKKPCQRCKTSSSKSQLQTQTEITPRALNQDELAWSLQILKKGAVSALIEKDDHLASMTKTWTDNLELYKNKLGECMQVQEELHRSHHELSIQLDQERHQLRQKLEERQEKIFELIEIIQELKDYIEQMERSLQEKEMELSLFKEENEKMRITIEEYELKNVIDHLQIGEQEVENEQQKKEKDLLETKYLKEIEDLKYLHERQIQTIIRIYEEKIIEKNLEKQEQHEYVEKSPKQYPSSRSLNRSRSNADPHSPLHPPSLASQPSVHNLREQILPQEHLSQFTKQIFSIPSMFHKQQSYFSQNSQDLCKKSPTKDEETETQGIEWKKSKQIEMFWEKTKTFAAGFFSGASLGSIISFVVLKCK